LQHNSEKGEMMKKNIKTNKDGLEIKIFDVDSKQDELLKNFQACQEGSCDCPSDEYVKLEKLDIKSSDNEIVLNLKAKKNQKFDKSEVEKCVDYVVNKVSGK
jgi:hypothetical protein